MNTIATRIYRDLYDLFCLEKKKKSINPSKNLIALNWLCSFDESHQRTGRKIWVVLTVEDHPFVDCIRGRAGRRMSGTVFDLSEVECNRAIRSTDRLRINWESILDSSSIRAPALAYSKSIWKQHLEIAVMHCSLSTTIAKFSLPYLCSLTTCFDVWFLLSTIATQSWHQHVAFRCRFVTYSPLIRSRLN